MIKAQNLVPNSTFSLFSSCPFARGQIFLAEPWYSPNGKTTDFIHSCGLPGFTGAPSSRWGYEAPARGSGYAGIRTWLTPSLLFVGENYREYLAVALTKPLEEGEDYFVSFKVSVADSAQFITDDIGLAFYDTVLPHRDVLELDPVIENQQGRFINNTVGWFELSGFYRAEGWERHLVIGNFKYNQNTSIQSRFGFEDLEPSTYFFVDDVIVEPCAARFPDTLITASDSAICPGESVELEVAVLRNATFSWEDGSQDTLRTVDEPARYIIDMSLRGCKRQDTFELRSLDVPMVELGNDTTLCPGQELQLSIGNPQLSVTWSDASQQAELTVQSAGTYAVDVTNGICTVSDSILVSYDTPFEGAGGLDTTICIGDEVTLKSSVIGASYIWEDDLNQDSLTVTSAGTYWVAITTTCFEGEEEFRVAVANCACEGLFPNIFTPNNDGYNDVFVPELTAGVTDYQLEIYDQWGRQCFESSLPGDGWDGHYLGGNASEGVYFWRLEYVCFESGRFTQQAKNGTVTLIR